MIYNTHTHKHTTCCIASLYTIQNAEQRKIAKKNNERKTNKQAIKVTTTTNLRVESERERETGKCMEKYRIEAISFCRCREKSHRKSGEEKQ